MAVNYTQEITLDLNANSAYTTIAAKQGDDGSRFVLVHLTQDNIEYKVNPDHQVYFRCRKPDGHSVIDPASVVTEADVGPNDPRIGCILVELTAEALRAAGRAYADVVEYDSASETTISTASFILLIVAAPDVAKDAISSNEFGYLQEVVNNASNIINEAEAWANGHRAGTPVGYVVDSDVTLANFDTKKNRLYIYDDTTQTYISVAESQFDPTATYYERDPALENNAKYYAEEAETIYRSVVELTVEAETLPAGSSATVEKTINSSGYFNFEFGIPKGDQGIQGERGASTAWIGTEPPIDDEYIVWLNPNAAKVNSLFTAEQVIYDPDATYSTNRIGYTVQHLESIGDDVSAAVSAANAAVDSANAAVDSANQAVESANQALIEVDNKINVKITNPAIPTNLENNDYRILTISKVSDDIGAEPTINYAWTQKLNYKNNLISDTVPKINGRVLHVNNIVDSPNYGTMNWSSEELGLAPVRGGTYYTLPSTKIPKGDLNTAVQSSLNLADNSIQNFTIRLNDEDYQVNKIDNSIDLGLVLRESTQVFENYLDNPWFTINQRGKTNYPNPHVGDYIYDRWKILIYEEGQSRSIVAGDNSLYISSNISGGSAQQSFSLGQILSDETWQALSGKEITLSLYYSFTNGVFTNFAFHTTCPVYGETYISNNRKQLVANSGWGIGIRVDSIGGKNRLLFEIMWHGNVWSGDANDSEIYIQRAKIELGIMSTLPQSVKPLYSEELKKCQRYFRYYGGKPSDQSKNIILGQGIAVASGNTGRLDWCLQLNEPMVSQPSIVSSVALTAKRGFEYASNIGTISSDAIAASTFFEGVGGLYLNTTTSGLTINVPYFVILPATASVGEGETETISYLTLSAEL